MKSLHFIDVFYFTVLSVLSFLLTKEIASTYDLIAGDEISYLRYGTDLFTVIRFDWGFAYNLWYKFLSLFADSNIELYYFNYKILIMLVPVLLFICLKRYGMHSFIAFVIAYLYLVSKLHITTWPFVSDFCIVIMLTYFIVKSFIEDEGWTYIVLVFFSLLLYLTRPEYVFALMPASFFAVYKNINHKIRWLLLIPVFLLFVYAGAETRDFNGFDRGFFAFAQHYFVTYTIWNPDVKLGIYDYFEMVPEIFGKSFSLWESMLFNPLEIARHIATCTGFYFLNIIKAFEDLLLPHFIFRYFGKAKHLLFLLLLVLMFLYIKRNKSKCRMSTLSTFHISILFFFISAAVSNFVIGYNPHYIQLHFILLLLLGTLTLFRNLHVNNIVYIILFLLIILFHPSVKQYTFQQADYKETKYLPIQQLAKFVNSTNDKEPHFMIAYQTSLHFLFDGNNFGGSDVFAINKPFLQFLNATKTDYIYVNQQLLNDEKLQKDKEWLAFIENPQKYGFNRIKFNGTKNYLLVK